MLAILDDICKNPTIMLQIMTRRGKEDSSAQKTMAQNRTTEKLAWKKVSRVEVELNGNLGVGDVIKGE